MKLKRIVLLILILSFMLIFTACKSSESTATAVTIGDAKVDGAIFAYYLDTLIPAGGDVESKEAVIGEAEKLCAHYVYVNTEFEKRGLKLSSSEKNALASEVEDLWNLYGLYYENIGVTKADLTKIKTSEAYEDALINSIYGEGGEKEIKEADLKSYFNNNYIFFKVINVYLSGDEKEDKATKETLTKLQKKIKDDTTIDDVNKEYVESIGGTASESLEVSYMKKGTDSFPEDFFTTVVALETGDSKVLTYDDYIFLVSKCDSDKYFSDYKATILLDLSSETLTDYLNETYSDKTITGAKDEEYSCYSTIINAKTK